MVYESVISKKDLLEYGVEYSIGIFYKDLSWAKSIYKILYKKLNASIYVRCPSSHQTVLERALGANERKGNQTATVLA